MALPSSPPLLPQEHDLPAPISLLPLASRPENRKRQWSDYGSCSSDPLFSDNTEDDEGTDINQPRKKKLVRGPWWNVRRRSKQDLRRNIAKKEKLRVADSGVWMGSDASEDSIDSILSSQQRMQELIVENEQDETDVDDTIVEEPTVENAEAYAARLVQSCVDRGHEVVDLGDLRLNHLSHGTLKPLHQLIRQSFSDLTQPPSEDEFGPLTPSIQLILSTNRLTSLPTEICNLGNITVLSLRNNHLRDLPPALERLNRLQELNIASNEITYLPWQLFGLFERDDTNITMRPNPLVEPTDFRVPASLLELEVLVATEDDLSHLTREEALARTRQIYWSHVRPRNLPEETEKSVGHSDEGSTTAQETRGTSVVQSELEIRLTLSKLLRAHELREESTLSEISPLLLKKEELYYIASSAIRYYRVDSTPVRLLRGKANDPADWSADLDLDTGRPTPFKSTNVPSLFELALRSVQASHDLGEFLPDGANGPREAPDYGMSASVSAGLRKAATNAATYGNETCSTCGRNYIIARAEWMEYWFHGRIWQPLWSDRVVPFLRKACSWDCARPTEVGTFKC